MWGLRLPVGPSAVAAPRCPALRPRTASLQTWRVVTRGIKELSFDKVHAIHLRL